MFGTGQTHGILEFIQTAARVLGHCVVWEGSGEDEVGRIETTGEVLIKVNPEFYRPAEVDVLIADASKAFGV